MSTIPQQIQALKNNISSLRALVNGSRDQGKFYAMSGDFCVFGCKITQGTSAADMYLAMEGQAAGDDEHENPDIAINPIRHEEYPNIAFVYGELFEMSDVNASDTSSDALLLDDAPATAGYGRYDLVYAYVGQAGPAVAILTGTASAAVKTDFDANGIDGSVYPSAYDPALPHGTFPLARVYVQVGDTGIANARIADLRDFNGRLNARSEVSNSSTITAFNSSGLSDGVSIFFSGRDTVNDGGGGWFTFSSASVATADGGIVFAPTGGGRLLRDGYHALGFNGDINVMWFGAKGDGSTNDSTAFQLAVNYAETLTSTVFSTGVRIVVPVGIYIINGTIDIIDSNITFASERAVLKDTTGGTMFEIGDPTYAASTYGISFKGITFLSSAITSITSIAIKCHRVVKGTLEDCWFQNWYQSIEGNRLYGYQFTRCWFLGTGRYNGTTPALSVNGDAHVILQDDPINNVTSGSNKFTDCEFWGLGQDDLVGGVFYGYAASVRVVCSDTAQFNNCHFYQCETDIEIVPDGTVGRNRVMDLMFSNCYFDYAKTQNVLIGGTLPSTVTSPAGVYKNIRFSNCFFRDSSNGVVVSITEGVSPTVVQFTTLQIMGGSIETQDNRAIMIKGGVQYPTFHSIQGVVINGVSFSNTNISNTVTDVMFLECDGATVTNNTFLEAANPVSYGVLVDSRSEGVASDPDFFNISANDFALLAPTVDAVRYQAYMSNLVQSNNILPGGYGASIKDLYRVTTIDATPTIIFRKFVQNNGFGLLKFTISGVDDTGAKYQVYDCYQAFLKTGASPLTLIGSLTVVYSATATLTTAPTLVNSSGFLEVNVTGANSTNVDWVCDANLVITGH